MLGNCARQSGPDRLPQGACQRRGSLADPVMRSEVIGSLLRPPYLTEARRRQESSEITAAEFKRLEDRAVDEAIEIQTQAGIDVITDGEM